MDATRVGYDYIQIHRDRLGYNQSTALNEHQWIQIAAALADDLALVVKRLDNARTIIEAITLENISLKENDALCSVDRCGYIKEYKKKLEVESDALAEVINRCNHRQEKIDALQAEVRALEHLLKDIGDMTVEEIANAVANVKGII